ncbi:Aste57867_13949 [Aphanomyces stellatus]|uniref:Aste57867_13949 protein n=1 Tax=Aphanomyces stellatus TaxID=120398 RepID=A0A485KZG5_9STRA|nr:hypothetical protein As57867_013898 [Aphanomyces stellatus]VFT90779.1 Aste57867_13949 [Aphanomyces stellatus]
MNDPRMGKALVALLQASVYATACPVIGSICVAVKQSGHPIFAAKNKRRHGDNLVVKLSLGRHEIDFFNVQHAIKGIVKYIDGAEVQLDSFRCHALILERGSCSGLRRRPLLRTNLLLRYNFVEEVVRAVQGCHNLNHIHGDVKLNNVMVFVAAFGGVTQYKLIDFDNATRVGQPMTKHCTPEYCPPEMTKYILGHTTEPVVADTSFDVWCTAVLILKL